LLDHVGTIGDGDVRDQYRSDWINRFNALNPATQRRPWVQRAWSPKPGGRFVPPPRPASAQAKQVGESGLNPELGHAVLQGLARFPALIGTHAEAVATLPLADRKAARLRDIMLEAAMTNAELDQERLNTILGDKGAAALMEELSLKRGLAFSFTRRDADEVRGCRDLALVIETLAARPGMEAALAAATGRLETEGDEAAFREQQRLREAKEEADRQLATLIEGGSD
jgi:DNA primase